MGTRGRVVVDGEVYALQPCPRREIVRAWREVGGSMSMLVAALSHPGVRYIHVGKEPPEGGGTREPRRPLSPEPSSEIALEPPDDED
jgi:hypothetical protein